LQGVRTIFCVVDGNKLAAAKRQRERQRLGFRAWANGWDEL
jgi:hypothetical protein